MREIIQSTGFSSKKILQLSKRERQTMERAQAIAQKVRSIVGEDDYRNDVNMNAAQVEHCISELLENEIVLACRILEPSEFAVLFASQMPTPEEAQ